MQGVSTSPDMSNKEYPKVLVISGPPISRKLTGGITVGTLFEGWPEERITQVFVRFSVSSPPDYMPGTYIRLGLFGRRREVIYDPTCSPGKEVQAAGLQESINEVTWAFLKHLRKNEKIGLWLRLIQELWYSSFIFWRAVRKQVAITKPDVIYAFPGNFFLSKLTAKACGKFDGPLFLHASDDFIESLYDGVPGEKVLKSLSKRWYNKLVARSSRRAAISEVMAEEYESRYGLAWGVLPTLVDRSRFDTNARSDDGTLRLTYAGNLGLGRWDSLKALSQLLSEVAEFIEKKIVFEVYAAPEQVERFCGAEVGGQEGLIELKGWIPQECLPSLFHNSDVLVHVESKDPNVCRYTRLSLSTKLSQYMSAGRCILALGDRRVGSMKTLIQAGSGVVLEDASSPEAKKVCVELLGSKAIRDKLAVAGLAWSAKWVDQCSRKEEFRQELCVLKRQWSRS